MESLKHSELHNQWLFCVTLHQYIPEIHPWKKNSTDVTGTKVKYICRFPICCQLLFHSRWNVLVIVTAYDIVSLACFDNHTLDFICNIVSIATAFNELKAIYIFIWPLCIFNKGLTCYFYILEASCTIQELLHGSQHAIAYVFSILFFWELHLCIQYGYIRLPTLWVSLHPTQYLPSQLHVFFFLLILLLFFSW